MSRLLIIYYHEIVKDEPGSSYQKLEVSGFEEQMKYLHDHQYRTLLFPELMEEIPDKAVIVSFDDGFMSVYENALPIMKKYDIRGNVYLPTAFIGKEPPFMTWDMIEELHAGDKWYFAAHTHNHVDIRTLDSDSAADEISRSHELFRSHLGYTPDVFCMPYGAFDRKSVRLVKKAGRYEYMLGSFYGHIDTENMSGRVLPRIGISNDDSIETFADKLEGRLDWKGQLQKTRLLISNLRGQTIDHYEY